MRFPRERYIPAEFDQTARNALDEKRGGPQSSLGHDFGGENSLLFGVVAEVDEEGPAGVAEDGGESLVGEEGDGGNGGNVGLGGEGGKGREGDVAGEGVGDPKGAEGGEFEGGGGEVDSRGIAERVVGREAEQADEAMQALRGREGVRGYGSDRGDGRGIGGGIGRRVD